MKFIAVAALLATASAQAEFDELTFEEPTELITVKVVPKGQKEIKKEAMDVKHLAQAQLKNPKS